MKEALDEKSSDKVKLRKYELRILKLAEEKVMLTRKLKRIQLQQNLQVKFLREYKEKRTKFTVNRGARFYPENDPTGPVLYSFRRARSFARQTIPDGLLLQPATNGTGPSN